MCLSRLKPIRKGELFRQGARAVRFRLLSGALLKLCTLTTATAAADPTTCAASYEKGQRLLATARLLDAASEFRYCGSPACPAIMHAECLGFLDRVEAATPTIVVRTGPETGAAVRVALDGDAERSLDGRAMVVDPGTHQLRITAPGYATQEHRFLVAEGEKLKTIEVRLRPLPQAPHAAGARSAAPVATASRTNLLPWVVTAGVATAGAAGFVYWGLGAREGEAALASCSPDCARAQVAEVKQDYLLSNVSLGVGASGLVAMGVWYLVGVSRDRGQRASRLPALSLTPAAVSVSGSF